MKSLFFRLFESMDPDYKNWVDALKTYPAKRHNTVLDAKIRKMKYYNVFLFRVQRGNTSEAVFLADCLGVSRKHVTELIEIVLNE